MRLAEKFNQGGNNTLFDRSKAGFLATDCQTYILVGQNPKLSLRKLSDSLSYCGAVIQLSSTQNEFEQPAETGYLGRTSLVEGAGPG